MNYQLLNAEVEFDHRNTDLGPRDYQRGNFAASVCTKCGYDVAIPEISLVEGEHVTICTCLACGTVSL